MLFLAFIVLGWLFFEVFLITRNFSVANDYIGRFLFMALNRVGWMGGLLYWVLTATYDWPALIRILAAYGLWIAITVPLISRGPKQAVLMWLRHITTTVFIGFLGMVSLIYFFGVLEPLFLVLGVIVLLGSLGIFVLARHQVWLNKKFRIIPYDHGINKAIFEMARTPSSVAMLDSKRVDIGLNALYMRLGNFVHLYVSRKLLSTLKSTEIEGIIAHELGHAYHRHLSKRLAMFIFFIVVVLCLNIGLSVSTQALYGSFEGLSRVFLYNVIFLIGMKQVTIRLMHKQEYEADDFAKKQGYAPALQSALSTIYFRVDEKKFDPLYTRFSRTHPPIMNRIDKLKSMSS